MQLGKDGGRVYRVGVAAHAFKSYSDCGWPRRAWVFQNDSAASDGDQVGDFFGPHCFEQGDSVSVVLERRLGVEGVLRVEVSGRLPREIEGLPKDGVLYPIVCLINAQQTITMLPAATAAHLQQAARPSPVATPPSSPRARPTKRVVFPFSHVTKNGECAHRSPNVTLSFDRLTAAVAKGCAGGWARAECGITSGCGVVRWMVQLCSDREGHGRWLMLGVASERFVRFSACGNRLKHAWFFQKAALCVDGGKPVYCVSPCFDQGDLVTLELERFPGSECVLRIQVAGRTPQEIRGLPQNGLLYPIVCLANDCQSVTMIPARAAVMPSPMAEAPAPEPAATGSHCDLEPAPLLFSSNSEHMSPDVQLSRDRRSASLLPFKCCGWVRGECGFEAGCGVARWAVKLSSDDGGCVYVIGVASDAISSYCSLITSKIKHLWAFENGALRADGDRIETAESCFNRFGAMTLELERFPGAECVLRIQAAGRMPQEIRGLPQDGLLYPIVCLVNDRQRVSMVPLPQ